ncbi:triacylglycerol lipase-like protein [Lindgomyces ingoldianus]|uniref:Triacylglycerol lipase-like protein n=1 Tax=Lindgomyces ingoldianus TaxID=673940 RepID=A0ACB6QK86_9PLEO|nr:triacylglycerol lipase-like protein [Lindgomyces ingoldianus]KAF2467343.1 triacylglycerol lipase-like protein [Lindgomyces ingoldianus]
MRSRILAQSVLAIACCTLVLAVDTVVDVGYSKYRGRVVGDGTTQWLGIRYAAPPLGQLRFAAPKNPLNTTGIQDASKFGSICLPQNPTDWSAKPNPRFQIAEDCLFLNVFAPSNATASSKLPVMFFIQGGGFGSNSNANYNGSDLAREGNMVIVSINYRVGPCGFLQSEEVVKEGSLNNGMKDQIKALEWVRDNVEKFGGNPEHVVLNGDSAGASSIVILLVSPALRNANLFVGAISESASEPTLRTLAQGQDQYNCLLKASGCSNSTASLSCLRSLNATKLQTTNCWFNPHIDGSIIPDTTFSQFEKGDYAKVPTIFGSCTDEGTKNAPQTTDTLSDAHAFFLNQCPSLSNSSLTVLDEMYILNHTAPVFPSSGKLWIQASNAIGDFRSHCVDNFYQSVLARDGMPTWNYRYGVIDPDQEAKGFGAYHTVELYAVWGPNNTDGNPPKSYLTSNAGIVPVVRSYWTSFIRHLDPNVGRMRGTPVWEQWDEERRRMHFVTNETGMERMGGDQLRRCEVLEPMMRALEQDPPKGVKTQLDGSAIL